MDQQPSSSSSNVLDNETVLNKPSTSGETSTEEIKTIIQNDDDDEIVSLADVLKESDELESDAIAVLGGSDDQNCTYETGYVPRQPLYACSTCEMKIDPDTSKKYLAGFCLACSYHCHEGHELVELYTKRNFRCDCGNEKFANTICKLTEKTGFNDKNAYNQNFSGLYCTCNRPYPDPDDNVSDFMIQCGICEDWFHKRHLNLKDKTNEYAELVCFLCAKKYNFLNFYYDEGLLNEEQNTESSDSGIATSETNDSQNDACKLVQLKQKYLNENKTETFDDDKICTLQLDSNWRSALCKCVTCLEMYKNFGIEFIVSKSDMVASYEQGTIKSAKEAEKDSDLKELKKLPHVQQIELLTAYNEFKRQFQEFLEPFRENEQVVRKEDVNEFFEKLKSQKRQRVDMPYNCK